MATNADHYLDPEDAATAVHRKAIAQQVPLSNFLSNNSDRFLASNEAMVQLFKDLPEALVATGVISEPYNLPWLPASTRTRVSGAGGYMRTQRLGHRR